MLIACIAGFIVGILLLLIALITVIACLIGQDMDTTESIILGVCGFGGIFLLILGICNCVEGNKVYDKMTNIYSLQPSEQFVLGVGKGNYYYNLESTNGQVEVSKTPVVRTTLIQDDSIEYTYLLEHKVKWEKSEYFLYVPTNVRIIQYTIK